MTVCVSGSYEPPVQLVPPSGPDMKSDLYGPSGLLSTIGSNSFVNTNFFEISTAFACSSGVKSSKSFSVKSCFAYAGGLVGYGCVGDDRSPGTVLTGTRRSSIGQTGWPVTRSNTYRNDCLLGIATALIARPFTVMSARIGADERSKSQSGW